MSYIKHLRTAVIGIGIGIAATACSTDHMVAPGADEVPAPVTSVLPPSVHASGSKGSWNNGNGNNGNGNNGSATVDSTSTDQSGGQGSDDDVAVISRKSTLSHDVVVSQLITPLGGIIILPEAGLAVTFAPNAVATPTLITVTAYKGKLISYGFEPHGTTFNAPVMLIQDMSRTTVQGNQQIASTLYGGYTPDGTSDINQTVGDALVSEQYPATTTFSFQSGSIVLNTTAFTIQHFSGYILSSGRR